MLLILLVFFIGFAFGRKVDLAQNPNSLIGGLLSLIPGAYMLAKSQLNSGGCSGGTCIADGYMLVATLGMAIGALGYLAGGTLCSLARSGAYSETTQKKVRVGLRVICGLGIVFGIAWILA